MPFDPTPIERPAVSRNGVELAKLRVLEEALRAEMPQGFRWHYWHIHSCAVGLALYLGLRPYPQSFGLKAHEYHRVFLTGNAYGFWSFFGIRPRMVADELRKIIAREEADTGA